MSDDDKVSVGCKIGAEKRRRFRMLAATRDTTMSAIIRGWIEDELAESEEIESNPEEQPAD